MSVIVTYASNLRYVGVSVSPQHLDCNIPSLVSAFIHIPKPSTVQRNARWIIAHLNPQ